jgi:lipoate-protein ligase A
MAVDAALLESAVHEGVCTVRCYQWESPTLSIGYFQSMANVPVDAKLSQLPVVRRLSGGGAIVHHHELTYSCSVPADHPLACEPRRIYTTVHECLIAILGRFGLSTGLRGTAPPEKSSEFLCFGRADGFDLVMGGHKVLGSAQRRRKGAVLQHGSLILSQSEFATEFIGLSELSGRAVSAGDLLNVLPEALGKLFGPAGRRESLTEAERSSARSLILQCSVSRS